MGARKKAASSYLPQPPPLYGKLTDDLLCRHVRVNATSSLREIKTAILKAYEDQYKAEQITLYTRMADEDEATQITTDRMAKLRLLSYGNGFSDGDPGTALLIVSPIIDDSESTLLVLPASHSPSYETVIEAAGGCTDSDIVRLANSDLFDPLPLPSHIDDWLAQYREPPQSVADLQTGPHVRAKGRREVIYLQPIECSAMATDGAGHNELYAGVAEYLAAFFDGTCVQTLPPITMKVSKGRGTILGKPVRWRDYCPHNGQSLPHGQLDAGQILDALRPKLKPGGAIVPGTGALPADGICVLGVTMTDLWVGSGVFTGGLACTSSCVGVLSFCRYQERTRLAHACSTAAHEVLHMHGITHCVHRACLMNGSGHSKESDNIPPYLCPVDLAKLKTVLGSRCELHSRYGALLRFCESHGPAFAAQAAWLRRALSAINAPAANADKAASMTSAKVSVKAAAATDEGAVKGDVPGASTAPAPSVAAARPQTQRPREKGEKRRRAEAKVMEGENVPQQCLQRPA